MSLDDSVDDFTFVWKIKNFSMWPVKPFERMLSSNFVANTLSQTTWRLEIYPKGQDTSDCDNIACFLRRVGNAGDEPDHIMLDFNINIEGGDVSWHISKKVIGYEFRIDKSSGHSDLCKRALLEEKSAIFLPDDTLTLSCYMVHKKKNPPVDARSTNNDKPRNPSNYLTHIKLWNFCFNWKPCELKPLTSFQPDFGSHSPLSFTFSLGEVADEYARIEIKTTSASQFFVKCNFTVVSAKRGFQDSAEDKHLYLTNNSSWIFKPFLKNSHLKGGNYTGVDSDQLNLLCKVTTAFPDEIYGITNSASALDLCLRDGPNTNVREHELLTLYNDEKFCDVSLRVDDKTFPAHKAILCAKSSVFHAMFEKDMKEKNTGVVDICDVEAETVDTMLKFMYSDVLEEASSNVILQLYFAADKYNVVSLKQQCSSMLKSSFSVANVCEVLVAAYFHSDQDLMKAAENFIFIYSNKIFKSECWKLFMDKYPKPAAEVMHRFCVKLLEI